MNKTSSKADLHTAEQKSIPTEFQELAKQVKADIENNLFGSLLIAPGPKAKQKRPSKFDHVKRGKTVSAVNDLRYQGLSSKAACKQLKVPYSSYQHWAMLLKVEFVK